MSSPIGSSTLPAPVLPGLTLLLSRSVPGSAGAAFVKTLEARVGRDSGAVVLHRDALERNGVSRTGPLGRASFERWLSERALAALRRGTVGAEGRARFPIFVVGSLDEALARRHGMELPERLRGAIGRISLPRGVEPLLVGIWLLPDRWTPLEGAELFAWLKEFAASLADMERESERRRGYTLDLVLGRSDVQAPAVPGRLSRPDHDLATRAAEFVAACHACRTLDWVLAAGRGLHHHGRFHSLGITWMGATASHADPGTVTDALDRSQVLWPTAAPTERRDEWVARAVLGVGTDDPLAAQLEGWDRVALLLPATSRFGAWLCRLAFGLNARDLIGCENWRAHYRRMPAELRRELHSSAAASELPDPLERPAPPVEEEAAESDRPLLPVL